MVFSRICPKSITYRLVNPEGELLADAHSIGYLKGFLADFASEGCRYESYRARVCLMKLGENRP